MYFTPTSYMHRCHVLVDVIFVVCEISLQNYIKVLHR
jgi:hypothetical protein